MATTAPLPYDLDAPLGGLRFKDSADEELALLVAEASESAFAALYERHCQPLYRYCRSIVRDDVDAQDAFQTAWARALVALRRGQRDAPVRPWLYRIAHNESISVLRRRRRTQPLDDVDHRVGSAEDHALDRERFTSLVSDLQDLPERSRGALLMRELSGLSHEEIAAALDTSVSAARQCIYEARRELSDLAAGRATPCDDICRRISDGDRRVLRGRRIAAHLRDCPSCAAFASTIDTRRTALHALAPWLPAAAAAGVLHSAFRAGWGTGAAGTGAAGAGVAGTGAGAGAAGTGVAGTTGAAMTSAAGPAAVTAGVVTKAVGVPLLGKSLLAVIALTAGVASVAGTGESGGTATTPARAHAVPRPLQAAPAGRLTPAPAFSRAGHRPSTLPSHGQGATPGQAAAAAHGASRSAGGPHGAAGNASRVAPGQAITGTPPGQARKPGTAPPGQAAKAGTTSPPGQVKKLTGAPPGQARKTATTPPGQAKRKATAPPGQAKKTTTPPGQATKSSTASSGQGTKSSTASSQPAKSSTAASSQPTKPTTTPTSHASATSTTTPPSRANSTSTRPPGQSHASSTVAATASDVSGNLGVAHAKLARSTP